MDEWTVVTAIVVLAGLIVTVAKPLLSLNSTIISLTDAVKVLEKKLQEQLESIKKSLRHSWNRGYLTQRPR